MARGRFISKAICLDEKVDKLSDDTCRLLFTWLITQLDCEGRMHGDARTIKSIVFPRREEKTTKIEKYLQEMEKLGLILRYSVNGNQYLTMKNFERHQPGLRKDRESQSQIPDIPPELLQTNDGLYPTEVKVKVKVKDKEEIYKEESAKKEVYGEFNNVRLTDIEFAKLKEKFGEKEAEYWIDKVSRGKEAKGYHYKSDYAAVLNWQRRAKEKGEEGRERRALPKIYTDEPDD